jgi:predicted RNA binding protein YcfA (HicA-like mRNA interferase family)
METIRVVAYGCRDGPRTVFSIEDPRRRQDARVSTVTRRALTAWLLGHGFTELAGKATSHRRFRHESGIVITVPGHGRQNLSQKHVGMIVRQLEDAGFDREAVRRDLGAR